MKNFKLVLLLAFALLAQAGYSIVSPFASVYSLTSDTVTNSGDISMYLTVNGTYQQISIQPVLTKISGTVAGNTILYGTIDGTNYVQINTDTLKATNQTTNTKVWVLDNSNYKKFKVTTTGSGTMAAKVAVNAFLTPSAGQHAVTNMLSYYGLTSDTATNTGTTYVQAQVKNWYESVSIQAVVTKLSGTAAGTVTVQGSNDGTNYVTVNSSYITSSTLSVSNVTTNTKVFILTGSPYNYYRLSYTGSGTMACTLKGYILPSKK